MTRTQTPASPKIVVLDNQGNYVRLFVNHIAYYYPTDNGMETVVGVGGREFTLSVKAIEFEEELWKIDNPSQGYIEKY